MHPYAPRPAAAQADVEDMIWEVDDDCDKAVTWPEFQAMFSRCRNDKTGALPSAKESGLAGTQLTLARRQDTSRGGCTTWRSS
jgi:hypothetical protein